jgi:hypothetical protein
MAETSSITGAKADTTHHESNDITRVLGSVEEAGAALVELLAAVTAAEPAIALRGAL